MQLPFGDEKLAPMTTGTPPESWAQGLIFGPMTRDAARTIADTWKYPEPYHFYDATADDEDYEAFITPAQWPDRFWQVHHADDLVGFFTAEITDADSCEIGLGLRPDLTGGGRGLDFLRAGLETLGDRPMSQRVTLRVAAFNKRAISVYEAAGFTIVRTYLQPTNGGTFDFVDMELHRS